MASNLYPFMTKAQILAKLASDDEFVTLCLQVMDGRQEEVERDTRETIFRNRRGWMSSHAVNGSKLAAKVSSGEDLTSEEMEVARGMVSRYGKQLAAHFRQQAIAKDPSLGEVAKIFSAG